jgi:beta-glucosidase
MAGIDMSMVPENYSFCTDLLDLVIKGEVPMSRIDDAVTEFKNEIGIELRDNC